MSTRGVPCATGRRSTGMSGASFCTFARGFAGLIADATIVFPFVVSRLLVFGSFGAVFAWLTPFDAAVVATAKGLGAFAAAAAGAPLDDFATAMGAATTSPSCTAPTTYLT